MKKIGLYIASLMFVLTSCDLTIINTEIPGCTDPNSIFYNPNATVSDGSCATAVITEIDVIKFPISINGRPWDNYREENLEPDIQLVMGLDRNTENPIVITNICEGATFPNVHTFQIDNYVQLTNNYWYFQIYDIDVFSNDDFMGEGFFNPIYEANLIDNFITVSSSDGRVQIRIYFELV